MTTEMPRSGSRAKQDKILSNELDATFPASDPPSSTQPSGGITGPEVASDERLEKVRERAYAIWLDQGQTHGNDEQHWREAEHEIETEEKRLRTPK